MVYHSAFTKRYTIPESFIRIGFQVDRPDGALVDAPGGEDSDFFPVGRPLADRAGPIANQGVLRAGEGDAEGRGIAILELRDLLSGLVPEAGRGVVEHGFVMAPTAMTDAHGFAASAITGRARTSFGRLASGGRLPMNSGGVLGASSEAASTVSCTTARVSRALPVALGLSPPSIQSLKSAMT